MSGRDAVGMLGVNADCVAGWKGGCDSGGDAGEEARLDVDWEAGGNFSLSIQSGRLFP